MATALGISSVVAYALAMPVPGIKMSAYENQKPPYEENARGGKSGQIVMPSARVGTARRGVS